MFEKTVSSRASKVEAELPRSRVYVKVMGRKKTFQAGELETRTVVRILRVRKWMGQK